MNWLLKILSLLLSFFRNNKVEEIEHEAKSEIDQLDDGQPVADYLNE
jgi:hypothetical protein